jgi:hypothetical protein
LHRNRYFLKTTRAGSGSGFGGEISGSGSGKKVQIRLDPDPQHWGAATGRSQCTSVLICITDSQHYAKTIVLAYGLIFFASGFFKSKNRLGPLIHILNSFQIQLQISQNIKI